MTGFGDGVWMAFLAAAAAALAAACAVGVLAERRRWAAAQRRSASGFAGGRRSGEGRSRKGRLDDRLVVYVENLSRKMSLGAGARPARANARASRWCDDHLKRAGIAGSVTDVGFCAARFRLAAAGAVCGALAGLALSAELSVVLALVGVACGWASPGWAIRQRERRRADELERHLSEMLEVVALGLRSGLSFDRSLQLYVEHFDTLLARACASAQRQWALGLTTREQALRELASTFDSLLFSRVVENMVRSLRFGSSLADGLESAASQARQQFHSRKQEQVAKASVKMMVPTGVLMLPAMLIMVLGPVLLELMEGF